jgi:hypothetical protein
MKKLFHLNTAIWPGNRYFYLILISEAGEALKQPNSEANREVKASQLTLETTQVVPAVQAGKPRAKTVKGSDLGIHQTRLNGTYFKSNYGR